MHGLESSATLELADEIELVRLALARFLDSLQQHEDPHDLESELAILRAINLGVLSINGMVRTRLMLGRGARFHLEGFQEVVPSGGADAAPDSAG